MLIDMLELLKLLISNKIIITLIINIKVIFSTMIILIFGGKLSDEAKSFNLYLFFRLVYKTKYTIIIAIASMRIIPGSPT